MATITINGTLVNDQTLGLQDDDDAIDNTLAGLTAAFVTFLNNLPTGVTALSGPQKDFAGGVEAAISGTSFVTVNPQGSNVSDLFFSDASGNALDGDQVIFNGNPLQTVGGQNIYLWSFGNFALATTGNTAANKGEVVAAFYLNEAANSLSASVETVTFMPIAHPTASNPDDRIDWTSLLNVSAATSVDFGFAGAPSGSNLFMTFGNPTSVQIVVIGEDPLNQSEGGKINTKDVLNISQAGGKTSFGVNGNAINPDEGAFITYVTGADTKFLVPNLDQNEADIEANIAFKSVSDATGAGFTVNQTNPGVGPVTVKITAINSDALPGKDFVDGLDDGTQVKITDVSIVDFFVKGQTTPTAIKNADGTLTVTGLTTGDKVLWTTTDPHDRVLIENISNADGITGNDNNTFDIGGFSLTKGAVITASVGDKLSVDDDGPTTDLVLKAGAELRLDESVGADANDTNADDETKSLADANDIGFASIAAADLFTETTDFGTDGKAATDSKLFELTLAAGASGLTDTASNQAVVLSLVNGVIEGRTATGNNLVLTISVDKTDGDVEVHQYRAVVHGDATDPDEADTPESINAGLVGLKLTVTDGDKDTANDSIDIGPTLKLEDDGPTTDLVLKAGAELRLDESVGADAGDTNANDEAASADANDIGFATITAANLFTETTDFGSDGKAATNSKLFELTLAAGASGLTDTASGEAVELSLVNGVIEGRTETGDQLVLTISVDKTDGDVEVHQYRAVVHGDATDPDEADTPESISSGLVGLKLTVTDGDGDTANDSVDLGPVIKLEDDGPTTDLVLKAGAELRLDESVGADAGDTNAEDEAASVDANDIGFATITAANLFTETTDFGTDGKAASGDRLFELTVAAGASGLTDTASGQAVVLTLVNGVIEGRTATDKDLVLTISVDKTDGDVEVHQYRAVVHGDATDPDEADTPESINAGLVGLKLTVTDGDKDTGNDSIDLGPIIKLEDDGPNNYDPQNQSLLNLAGASISGDLDTGGNTGTDGFGSVVFTGFANGDAAKDTKGTPLTSGGKAIELNGVGTGLLTGYVDANNDNIVDAGETVFTLKLDATTDTYQFTLVKDIDDGSTSVTLDFDDVEGGNDQWFFFDSNAGTTQDQDVLFTSALKTNADGKDQTANTSANDIGVSNQWVGDSAVPTEEGLRIDFVNNVTGNVSKLETALNDENGFLFTNHFTVNNAGFTINQTIGGGTTDIKVRLSNATIDQKVAATTYAAFLGQSTIDIVGIVVTNLGTPKVLGVDYTVSGPDAQGFMTISGLDPKDHVTLAGATDYERIDVNYAGGDAFGINEITYDQSTAGNALDLQFKTLMADGDGDTSSGLIDINLQPADNSADTFTGHILGDKLFGGGGNDTINGGDGNDTITGGTGSDALTGGKGSDTYVYSTLADGKDSISGFDITAPGSGGDKLDVSAVLDLAGNTWTDGGTAATAVADGYITFTDVGGSAQVNVDIDGKAGATFTPTAMAVLTSVSFATAATDLNDNIVVG